MPYAEHRVKCVDCGALFVKRCNPSGAHRCFPCAIDKMVRSVMEMHDKSGPTWDHWRAGVREALEREDRRAAAERLRNPPSQHFQRL